MTEEQFRVHQWLERNKNDRVEIEQLLRKRQDIMSSMSVGKYDAEHIPTKNGENGNETLFLEYSIISEQIEKKSRKLSQENCRTYEAIEKVDNTMYRGLLIAIYVNHLNVREAGKLYNYEYTSAKEYRKKALDAVSPFIPSEVIEE